MLYAASGGSERAIAVVLGIARPTLREHFAYELANGRTVKRAQIHKRLEEAAAGGNEAVGALLRPDRRPGARARKPGDPARGLRCSSRRTSDQVDADFAAEHPLRADCEL
jgi:hypothetical protein